jgi:hypothetical protein
MFFGNQSLLILMHHKVECVSVFVLSKHDRIVSCDFGFCFVAYRRTHSCVGCVSLVIWLDPN